MLFFWYLRYNIIFTVLTYLIPVSVMGVCYSRMSYILWRSQSIGELSQRQAESIQSKRKVSAISLFLYLLANTMSTHSNSSKLTFPYYFI